MQRGEKLYWLELRRPVRCGEDQRADRKELVVRIDPHAWLLTAPLTVMLVQLYLLPSNSFAKRCWRHVTDAETLGWEWLGWRRSIGPLVPTRRAVFCMIVIALVLSSLASFAVFIGVLPG